MAPWLFVDSNVLLFAFGGPSPHKAPAMGLLGSAVEGRCSLHASVEAVREFCFHRLRRVSRPEAVDQTRVLVQALVLHPFDADVLDRSTDLVEHTPMRGRDAVHAATALHLGFTSIITADGDFAPAPGLEVRSPADALRDLG